MPPIQPVLLSAPVSFPAPVLSSALVSFPALVTSGALIVPGADFACGLWPVELDFSGM